MTTTNRSAKKITLCVLLLLSLSLSCIALTGCSHTLSGKYASRDGVYEVKFEKNGECTWYQSGQFFEGEYSWDDSEKCYVLEIQGNGFYSNTVFKATPEKDWLIVKGGVVDNVYFYKQ